MRRVFFTSMLLCLAIGILLSGRPAFGGAGRAISLTALESRLRSGHSGDVARLCGITTMSGFVIDKGARDLILIGEVDPSRPALYLDDLAVAFRNSRLAYASRKGDTLYYTAPGCSIDPDPGVIRELNSLGRLISGAQDPNAKQGLYDRWQQIGSRPQNVRVLGVPQDSHFAKVMVEADYFMKRLTDGSADLGIPGFQSLMDMRIRIARDSMLSRIPHQPSTINHSLRPVQSINRFWFCPGESTYTEEDGVVQLASCRVKLLTEEEYLTSAGTVAGMGRPDALARVFADSFTAKYDQIASVKPIYTDLEDLFRLVAVAKLMDDRTLALVGLKLPHLTGRYRIPAMPVGRTLPGITNLKEISETKEVPEGSMVMHMWLASSGGVSMDVRPQRVHLPSPVAAPHPSQSAIRNPQSQMRKSVLAARTSKSSLYWDFPLGR